MKVVIAMDSFKGCMTSMEAGGAAREGILAAVPDAEVIVKPLADGGEGTMEALCEGLGGEMISTKVHDPLGRAIEANYCVLPETKTAIVEMAQAAGLMLLTEEERDPYRATTYGVGEMICDAIDRGCRDFIVGIGGSATNDGGIGMLRALGYRFFDGNGIELGNMDPMAFEYGGIKILGQVKRICGRQVKTQLSECSFRVACDVTNPLCGENGATYVYGPQKGLTQEACGGVDEAMGTYADAVACFIGKDYRDIPGAGAAGGMGFAFVSVLGGKLVPGAELVMQATRLDKCLQNADLFLTGEGRIDGQTARGKAPMLASRLAKKTNPACKTIAFAGQIVSGAEMILENDIDEICSVTPEGMVTEQAMKKEVARENMACAVQRELAKRFTK